MEKTAKENSYSKIYQYLKDHNQVSECGYPEKRTHYDLFFWVNGVKAEFSLKSDKDILQIRTVVEHPGATDEELFLIAVSAIEGTSIKQVAYEEQITYQLPLVLANMNEDEAYTKIQETVDLFIAFMAEKLNSTEKTDSPKMQNNPSDTSTKETPVQESQKSHNRFLDYLTQKGYTYSENGSNTMVTIQGCSMSCRYNQDTDEFSLHAKVEANTKDERVVDIIKKTVYQPKINPTAYIIRESGFIATDNDFTTIIEGVIEQRDTITKQIKSLSDTKNTELETHHEDVVHTSLVSTQNPANPNGAENNSQNTTSDLKSETPTPEKTPLEGVFGEATQNDNASKSTSPVSTENTVDVNGPLDSKKDMAKATPDTSLSEIRAIPTKDIEPTISEDINMGKYDAYPSVAAMIKEGYADLDRVFEKRKQQAEYREETLRKKEALLTQERIAFDKEKRLIQEQAAQIDAERQAIEVQQQALNADMDAKSSLEKELTTRENELTKKEIEMLRSSRVIEEDLRNAKNQLSLNLEKEKMLAEKESLLTAQFKELKDKENALEERAASIAMDEGKLKLRSTELNEEALLLEERSRAIEERAEIVNSLEAEKNLSPVIDTTEVNRLKTELQTLATDIQELQKDINNKNDYISSLQEENASLTERNKTLSESIGTADSSDDVLALKNELQKVQEECKNNEEFYQAQKEKNDTLSKELDDCRKSAESDKEEADKKIAQLEKQCSDLQNQLNGDFRALGIKETLEQSGILVDTIPGEGPLMLKGTKDGCDIVISEENNMIFVEKVSKHAGKYTKQLREWNNEDITAMYSLADKKITCKKFFKNPVDAINEVVEKLKDLK